MLSCRGVTLNRSEHTSLADAWSGSTLYECRADLSDYVPLPEELAVAEEYAAAGDYTGSGTLAALEALFGLCAAKDLSAESNLDKQAGMRAALQICPQAPHAVLMQQIANRELVGDGRHIVGEDIEPGTYRSGRVSDCYWERTSGGGDTLANDFVSLAADGVTVTIRESDGGFVSEGCGVWERQP